MVGGSLTSGKQKRDEAGACGTELFATAETALAANLKPSYSESTHRQNRAKAFCGLKNL